MRPANHITIVPSAVVALLVAASCLGAAGCGFSLGSPGEIDPSEQPRTLSLARAEFERAAAAVLDGDREGCLECFPTDAGGASTRARQELGDVFDTLSSLPWRTFSFDVTPVGTTQGVYRVLGSGRLGSSGPPDRVAVVRYLRLGAAAGGVAVLSDETPEHLRRRYLMALHDPVALRRPGLLVLADGRARERAATVLAAAARALPRLVALGLDTSPTVVVTVFGSAEGVRDALAVEAATARLVFFSYPALRVAKEDWPTYDVGVMGPWLRDAGPSMEDVLAHELAHAYSVRWFSGADDPPSLLVEGIARAAEGVPAGAALRREVETGDQLWPLPESFAVGDVWDGGDGQAVRLGYDVGGSLVSYVVARWGPTMLPSFVQAVATAEPTEAGMDEALGETLDLTWRAFFTGWRQYVLSGA